MSIAEAHAFMDAQIDSGRYASHECPRSGFGIVYVSREVIELLWSRMEWAVNFAGTHLIYRGHIVMWGFV